MKKILIICLSTLTLSSIAAFSSDRFVFETNRELPANFAEETPVVRIPLAKM